MYAGGVGGHAAPMRGMGGQISHNVGSSLPPLPSRGFPYLQTIPAPSMPQFPMSPMSSSGMPMSPIYGVSHGGLLGPDSAVLDKIRSQVEYYFSLENLTKDKFLVSHMNDRGFVPMRIICGFRRMQSLRASPELVIIALQTSSIAYVAQGPAELLVGKRAS